MGKISFRCALCHKKVDDYYDSPMLKDRIWKKISSEHFDERGRWVSQMICVDCMEKKLGRKIRESDLKVRDGIIPRHVQWNTKFVENRFPKHKILLDSVEEQLRREKMFDTNDTKIYDVVAHKSFMFNHDDILMAHENTECGETIYKVFLKDGASKKTPKSCGYYIVSKTTFEKFNSTKKKAKTQVKSEKKDKPKEVVINVCFGGFGLSNSAKKKLREMGMSKDLLEHEWDIERDDKRLVKVVSANLARRQMQNTQTSK